MIRLRLFHRENPSSQIDSRVLAEGETSLGRGIKADWQIADPERDLSRLHMVLTVREGMLTVRDTSANGVFVGTPRTRLEPDRPTPVSRGESIVFGPYMLVAEEDAAARAPEAPILDDDPFGGARPRDEAPRARDPFGSALRPDPVKLDEETGDGVDAWARRREYQAGDWDPVAPHRRPDHAQLIGTAQGWSEPPAAPQREHGLGFDAPFTSPILRAPPAADAETVAIPSDWDAGPGSAAAPAAPARDARGAPSDPFAPKAAPPAPPFAARGEAAPPAADPFGGVGAGGGAGGDPILPPAGAGDGRPAAFAPDAPFAATPAAAGASAGEPAGSARIPADPFGAPSPIPADPFADAPGADPFAGAADAPILPAATPAGDPILPAPPPAGAATPADPAARAGDASILPPATPAGDPILALDAFAPPAGERAAFAPADADAPPSAGSPAPVWPADAPAGVRAPPADPTLPLSPAPIDDDPPARAAAIPAAGDPAAPAPDRASAPDAPAAAPAAAAPPAAAPAGDDALFASFCAGARLNPDAFAGEDRAALMERLGAVYRQAILGVADLMSERTALKNDFRMVRTTIRPVGNNPFKWVPPQRIAIELLRTDDGSGYSTGEAALNEALHDVKAHMLCVLAGMRGAIGATFDLLSPSEIEARTANRGFVMPGQRSAAAWSEYVDQYAAQRREADDSAEGPINRAFRQSYEDQAGALDGR